MDRSHFDEDRPARRTIACERITSNDHHTRDVDAAALQADVDLYNRDFDALQLVPKFTKGQPAHHYHPKRYIHDRIDQLIRKQHGQPDGSQSLKVCVDCIDDADFVNHLIYASDRGVAVQCVVDWRKMTLTHSDQYLRLKNSKVSLLGVFCMPRDPLIEVAPDMHAKFIIFGDEDCILGSFNITFDRWGANWESGMTFHSPGVCRLLDNIFQSIRGGTIQRYGVDPLSHFNLLYTFGRQATLGGKYYRPHQAILSEIRRAQRSIRLCSFLIGEMQGEFQDSVVDALIAAKQRGVEVRLILNGHLARQGDPGKECTMEEELRRPLTPAVARLHHAAIPVALAYGVTDHRVPYCPLHSKYCVIDDYIVLEGSFNWYNTSAFSHDLLVIAARPAVARAYLYEFQQILRLFRFPSLSFRA
jgi:phosphatidylserine/phosphatidylglycerophosphate/cardiolipin synthase-like enzyme